MDPFTKRIYMRIPGMKRIIEQVERAQRPAWPVETREKRMAEDAAKIREVASRPLPGRLPLKTQPWITEQEGIRFAKIVLLTSTLELPLMVDPEGDTDMLVYETVEELVQTWSVD